jgi:tetratricopeptide (TPR) repeat protein
MRLPPIVRWTGSYGLCKLYTGFLEEVIPLAEQAIRASPRDPQIGVWYRAIGLVQLLQSRTDDAILWFERACSANPEHSSSHGLLASAYALNDETEGAAVELAEARRLAGGDRFSSIGSLKAAQSFGVPKIRALYEATCFAGLRKAGVPEE